MLPLILVIFVYCSKRIFNETISKFKRSDDSASTEDSRMVVTDDVLNDNKERTYRNLRTRDLILERSKDAALIVA